MIYGESKQNYQGVLPRYVPADDTSEEAKRISLIDHDFSFPAQVFSNSHSLFCGKNNFGDADFDAHCEAPTSLPIFILKPPFSPR